MIFTEIRDSRLITVRRGGTLSDDDHHLLAIWAADCAEHVLPYFEKAQPGDDRPRRAIEMVRAWTRGDVAMMQSRAAGGHAMASARELVGPARESAYAAGQAACVAHVAAHELGAAAYAIRAARAADGADAIFCAVGAPPGAGFATDEESGRKSGASSPARRKRVAGTAATSSTRPPASLRARRAKA